MKPTKRKCWAIDTCSDKGRHLLGVYFMNHLLKLEPYQEGNTIALFRTRRQAREWLQEHKKKQYQAFPKMRVVRVTVEIT